ncbi:MAG: hypothetical protein Q4D14_03585 [Bacteroidales bacterium]|nr:hypothetical protein [Bacteroidales bacterium]
MYYKVYDVIASQEESNVIKLSIDYKDNEYLRSTWYNQCNESQIYETMNLRHNDTAYNRPIYVIWNGGKSGCHPSVTGHTFACIDVLSVDVTCSEDFDANHPANTSLNDVVNWVTISAMPYIHSDYTDSVDWSIDPIANTSYMSELLLFHGSEKDVCHKVDKKIVDMTAEDWMLNGGGGGEDFTCLAYLRFDNEPTIRVSDGSQKSEDDRIKKHIIITINGFDGKKNVTFTTECDMEF